jgi:phenylacetate-coenzyme A ligase PaaK-like adenylate-forming protein
VLRLFRAAAELVPAFKSFLAEAGVEPKKIVSMEDFRNVPVVVLYIHKHKQKTQKS